MQPQDSVSRKSKNPVGFDREFRGIRRPIQYGGGRLEMSNKSEAVVGAVGPRPSDVASQTARALFSLRESLMRGEFAPGERMAELPLVARFGVSRTPIRLALERLAHMGLLDVSASGGFTVRGYTP